ncbi:hypothetical protein ACIRSU_11245 [Streptomyces sp. NPDC101160]|uniref:hypothetical protein n=1 Tax=Streptomyces sp. NPDC101160 TaxID=3366118 RepID=UPI00381A94B0
MITLATESSELLHHLLLDLVIKVVIVVAALTVLALGLRTLWHRAGRTNKPPN